MDEPLFSASFVISMAGHAFCAACRQVGMQEEDIRTHYLEWVASVRVALEEDSATVAGSETADA